MRLFTDVSSAIADPHMRRAFELALLGRGTTSPNPMVGCVVVSDDEVVGEGYHERAGGPHAEAAALSAAGQRARDADVYVTLEPCNHHGRTAPCTEALIGARVARVHVGMRDPNPGVAGNGISRLREAGVEVFLAEDEAPFRELNEEWLHFLTTDLPFVRCKIATTLDGAVAAAHGERTAITGDGGREITMSLRSSADAVMVGAGTAAIDDPALTVRRSDGSLAPRQAIRIVWGREGVPEASLFADGAGPALALVPEDAAASVPDGVAVVQYPGRDGVRAALAALGREGIVSLLVEPGPRLLAALMDADAVEELVVLTGGSFAGRGAPTALATEATGEIRRKFEARESAVADGDAVTVWRRSAAIGS